MHTVAPHAVKKPSGWVPIYANWMQVSNTGECDRLSMCVFGSGSSTNSGKKNGLESLNRDGLDPILGTATEDM